MIKFVHSGDIHLGASVTGLGEAKRAVLQKALVKSFVGMIDHCIAYGADVLLLSGDILDSPSSDAAELVRLELGRLKNTRVFIALGNHDCDAAKLLETDNVHIFSSEGPEKIYIEELNLNVWGRSFSSSAQPESLLTGMKAEPDRLNLLCLHANVGGTDYSPVTEAELEAAGFDYAALGHKHSYSAKRLGRTTVCYSGCLAGLGFDETGKKGFVSGRLDENGLELGFVPSGAPEFNELKFNAADCDDLPSAIEKELNGRDIYRVTVSGTELSRSYLLSRLEDRAFHLEIICEAPSLPDSPFIRLLREELASDPEALDLALKALAGREDEI